MCHNLHYKCHSIYKANSELFWVSLMTLKGFGKAHYSNDSLGTQKWLSEVLRISVDFSSAVHIYTSDWVWVDVFFFFFVLIFVLHHSTCLPCIFRLSPALPLAPSGELSWPAPMVLQEVHFCLSCESKSFISMCIHYILFPFPYKWMGISESMLLTCVFHVCGRKGELWKRGQSPKRCRPWSRCWPIIQKIWSGTLCIVRTISSATATAEDPESESALSLLVPFILQYSFFLC